MRGISTRGPGGPGEPPPGKPGGLGNLFPGRWGPLQGHKGVLHLIRERDHQSVLEVNHNRGPIQVVCYPITLEYH